MHFILDLVLLLVGAAIVFTCYKRGFFKSVIHFFKTILAFLAAYFWGSGIANWICQKWVGGSVYDSVYPKIRGIYEGSTESFSAEQALSAVPDFLVSDKLRERLTSLEGSGEELVSSVTEAVSSPIATMISNVIGYLGVFLISLLAISLIATLLDKFIDKLPLIGTLNRILGLALGLMIATAVLLVVSSIFELIFANSPIYTESTLTRFFGQLTLPRPFRFLDVGGTWLSQIIG